MRSTILATALTLALACGAQDVVLIPYNATWKYLDDGSNQGTAWRASAFNDAAWASGPAQLGYGEGDEATVLSYGPNASAKYPTTYLRITFNVPDASLFGGYRCRFKRDDGFILYLNGTEVIRNNMSQSGATYTSYSYAGIGGTDESRVYEHLLSDAGFLTGSNTIAVELHQDDPASSDLSWEMELTGMDMSPSIYREPYLQQATTTGIKVMWKTDVRTDSRVRYGTSPTALNMSVSSATAMYNHGLTITGLSPNTTYWYAVGTSTADLSPVGDPSYFFKTLPIPSAPSPLRVWVTGDQGTGYTEQIAVRDAYLSYAANSAKADAWLMLGDNAYLQGREAEYQVNIFNGTYGQVLRNTCLWPAPGNHDYYSGASATTQTGTYYTLFSPPTAGQSGGVPSGTASYYSFDIGNAHFISLDSYGVSRSTSGAMAAWLLQDLAYSEANSDWVIVYFHHPPYTKGSHNSDNIGDSDGIMFDMRQNFLPILEAHGVDVVLCGHSHVYERSKLIDGHYGTSTTWNAASMVKDGSSGNAGTTGAYQKPGDLSPHNGAVYTVCGVSGKRGSSYGLNHPAMHMSTVAHWGSLILDIDTNDLSLQFLNSTGTIVDRFDIHKAQGTVKLAVKTMLEGPFDQGASLMHDSLRVRGLIPLAQPFTGLYQLHGEGGTEVISPAVLSATGPNAIVDWVLLELRSASAPAQVIASRAALLQRDCDVVDVDGTSAVAFHVPMGPYHVAVRHRNHFGCMTGAPLVLKHAATALDFTLPTTATWGSGARKDISGTMVLISGNAKTDAFIKYTGTDNDRDPVLTAIGGSLPTNTVSGYLVEDVTMDGTVKYTGPGNDRDPVLVAIGGTLPTNTITEQLP